VKGFDKQPAAGPGITAFLCPNSRMPLASVGAGSVRSSSPQIVASTLQRPGKGTHPLGSHPAKPTAFRTAAVLLAPIKNLQKRSKDQLAFIRS